MAETDNRRAIEQEERSTLTDVIDLLKEIKTENAQLKDRLTTLTDAYTAVSEQLATVTDRLTRLEQATSVVDEDALARKVVSYMPVTESVSPARVASLIADQLILPEVNVAMDEERVASLIAEKLQVPALVAEIDYQQLGRMVADHLPVREDVTADEIAAKVADQLILPDPAPVPVVTAEEMHFDYERLSELIASRIGVPEIDIDLETLSNMVTDKIMRVLPSVIAEKRQDETIRHREEEWADAVARKIGTIYSDRFEILVDDDGCDSIARTVVGKLDYDQIAKKVVAKLCEKDSVFDCDIDELTQRVSDKLYSVFHVDEGALAEKAASVLSNYLPDIDTADMAEKIALTVIENTRLSDGDLQSVAERTAEAIVERQKEQGEPITLDEATVQEIAFRVADAVKACEEDLYTVSGVVDETAVSDDDFFPDEGIGVAADALTDEYTFEEDDTRDRREAEENTQEENTRSKTES